jgi:hypothetical protein
MRQQTDCSHDYHRTSIHNNKNQNQNNNHNHNQSQLKTSSEIKINPLDLLKNQNNLTTY